MINTWYLANPTAHAQLLFLAGEKKKIVAGDDDGRSRFGGGHYHQLYLY